MAILNSIAETDAAGNSKVLLDGHAFSRVCMTSALFKEESSTVGSAVISKTRPLTMFFPVTAIFARTERVRRVLATWKKTESPRMLAVTSNPSGV